MIEGIAFLLTMIGIGVVILWAEKNDKVRLGGRTGGLLAMDEPKKPRPRGRMAPRP